MPSVQSESRFSIQQARELIKDLFTHKAWIYWTDFLVTISVGYAAASAI